MTTTPGGAAARDTTRHLFPPWARYYLRLVGLCALLGLILVIGSHASFERPKRVTFCHSCHTAMDLYVDDMQDPQSNTLAAIHYRKRHIHQEQCYRCHVEKGIPDAIAANIRGLRHLYAWVTDTATARGEAQIKLYGYYRNELCIGCHAGDQNFLAVEEHSDFQDDLLYRDPESGEPGMSCLSCHGPAHQTLTDKHNMTAQEQPLDI